MLKGAFMVTIQNYVRAQSIDEAYELNQKKGSCIIGGMLWTKMQDRLIQTAIDMCDLGLDKIEEKEEEDRLLENKRKKEISVKKSVENFKKIM